jgi:hypothetical protein
MIREFQLIDPRRLKGNKFSKTVGLTREIFDNPTFHKNTLVGADGEVYAIICFAPYWRRNFVSMFLIAENMPILAARELRKFLHDAIIDFNADRVQTESPACPELDRWHKFLGFTFEGCKAKMALDMDYNSWAMVRGRDF